MGTKFLLPSIFISLALATMSSRARAISIREATVVDLQRAFRSNELSSRQLTEFYLGEIHRLNPALHSIIEVNPDALCQADAADRERKARLRWRLGSGLHGIPILLKDNIGTKDELNTTAGSFALLGSKVARDAGVVDRLRRAGAVILGKASMSEWASFRSLTQPNGWSARGGQGKNPYVLSADPCGSSSGPAISVAANLVAVSLGTETDGSILCPSSANSVVGIKPTVGLTSRAGVIPMTPRQDTIGPISRTVADAVCVLEAIVGLDYYDAGATRAASKYIPDGGYLQFLKVDGLRGKRIGIARDPFFNFTGQPNEARAFQSHFRKLRNGGAVLVDNLKIDNISEILNFTLSGEATASAAEFKIALNSYLESLVTSPVRSLTDVITFNNNNAKLELMDSIGQNIFLLSEATNGIGNTENSAIQKMAQLTRDGFLKLMYQYKLDAVIAPGSAIAPVLAIGGFPGINVPAGYDSIGVPFGVSFGGLKGSEPKLIEIAYGFEQATKVRKPPTFKS